MVSAFGDRPAVLADLSTAHSGTSKGRAELFDRPANLRSTSLALRFLASQFASVPHVIGLELLNEPARGNMKLQAWYEKTIKEVQTVAGPHFPIYVHDSFDAPHYVGWNNHRRDFVVIDHHFYRLFGDPNENLDGEGQARQLRGDQAGNFAWLCEQARGNLVVGEWSGALKWENIKHLPDGERDRQHREFVRAELEMYERSSAGWFFWTLKKDGWDAGWSARDEVRAEILPNWVGGARFKGLPDESMCGQQLRAARGEPRISSFTRFGTLKYRSRLPRRLLAISQWLTTSRNLLFWFQDGMGRLAFIPLSGQK